MDENSKSANSRTKLDKYDSDGGSCREVDGNDLEGQAQPQPKAKPP